MRRPLILSVAILAGAFVLLQLVPYGHDHGAPPTTKRAQLTGAAGRIAARAGMDWHSNAAGGPGSPNVAPASLLVVNDVKGGRNRLNLSRWDHPQPDLEEV